MRDSGVFALLLLLAAQGICDGFDRERYVRDCPPLDFAKDVNEVKARMLSPQWRSIYSAYSARPSHDEVGVYAYLSAPELFSALKAEVVKGMMEKEVAQELARYGIRTVDVSREVLAGTGPCPAAAPAGAKVPILYLSTSIRRQPPAPQAGAAGESVYILSTRYDLYDWLWHDGTSCEIRVPLAGVTLAPSIWYRARYNEETLVEYMQNHVKSFLQTQYLCCVEREAWTQLSRAGQLPDWLKPQPPQSPPTPAQHLPPAR
ncbi:MAG: hypothetical protein FJ280_11025 [Planctomycetes bacterium]|nr:hypothetical protein [Planctomycetota bacterium]